MKKTGIISVEQRTAEIRPLPKKYYDPGLVMKILAKARDFYSNRVKRYEVQLEVVYTVPYTVTARSAKEATDYIRSCWRSDSFYFTSDDILSVAITTFRNGKVEKDVVL